MQLVIHNGKVIAEHPDYVDVRSLYPGALIVSWQGSFDASDLPAADPRSGEQRKQEYRDRRRMEYPPIAEQLDMLYHDLEHATTTWIDSIAGVKAKYPKPEAE